MIDAPLRATERFAVGFTDPRGAFGHFGGLRRPIDLVQRDQAAPDPRREAWSYIMRQWELWPRPDLIRAIFPPAFLHPSARLSRRGSPK